MMQKSYNDLTAMVRSGQYRVGGISGCLAIFQLRLTNGISSAVTAEQALIEGNWISNFSLLWLIMYAVGGIRLCSRASDCNHALPVIINLGVDKEGVLLIIPLPRLLSINRSFKKLLRAM